MTSTPRIPLKGPILYCALASLSMAGIGKYAQHRARVLHEWKAQFQAVDANGQFEPIDLASVDPLEQQLAGYMPLAGLGALEDMAGVDSLTGDLPGAEVPEPGSVEDVRSRRAPDWVYPEFGATARGQRHGAAADPTPRNVTLRVVDGNGEPLTFERLTARQSGPDGEFEARAYRTSDNPTEWAIGSPSVSPGSYATFELTGTTSEGPWHGTASIGGIPGSGDVVLGTTAFDRSE